MKTDTRQVFQVNISYNIESDDSLKALDTVLTCSPIKPLSFSVNPVEYEEFDDD